MVGVAVRRLSEVTDTFSREVGHLGGEISPAHPHPHPPQPLDETLTRHDCTMVLHTHIHTQNGRATEIDYVCRYQTCNVGYTQVITIQDQSLAKVTDDQPAIGAA